MKLWIEKLNGSVKCVKTEEKIWKLELKLNWNFMKLNEFKTLLNFLACLVVTSYVDVFKIFLKGNIKKYIQMTTS